MNTTAKTARWGKWCIIFVSLILCVGLCATQALAADTPYIIDTLYNNFTWLDPTGLSVGGTNDVEFQWDGTLKTEVTCPQMSNATLSSTCPFLGITWNAHDVAIYGPGTYTIYTGCPAGCPNCGTGTPISFTVDAGEIALHMLFDWHGNSDIDVVNVLKPKSVFFPSALWEGQCGYNSFSTVWDWMSKDFNGDGINGYPMVDGPFAGHSFNFNLREEISAVCGGVACNDHNFCTIDSCDPATGNCVHTPKVCNDNNACTTDTCDPISGCVFTAINGDDHNACTIDFCDPAVGIRHVPIVCNDNNACTADSCDPATGCVHTPVFCDDNNLCTNDSCDPATGCVFSPKCPACATCNPAVGVCGSCCPEGWGKSLTTRGGGQKPTTVDLQIQTNFTVMNDGCISGSGPSTVTCTPGTIMLVNVKAGQGPQPTSCTWNGAPLGGDYSLTITCPDVSGDVGKLICDNKDGGGKDTDRITISVQ